jgi:hypothetical protein
VSYAQLGKSGLRVSVPILGAMSFGMILPSPLTTLKTIHGKCSTCH